MKRISVFLIFLILILILPILFIIPKALASTPIDYTYEFEASLPYNNTSVIPDPYAEYNYRPQTNYDFCNEYFGNFSFSSDAIGGNPSNWTIDEGGGSINVYDTLEGHDTILELNDTDNADNVIATQTFDNSQVRGIIEFWAYSDDVTDPSNFGVREATDNIHCRFETEKLKVNDGGAWVDIDDVYDSTWYHIKIRFDCDTDLFYISLNGKEYGDYDFKVACNSMTNFRFWSHGGADNYKAYYDAIGYNWTNYKINDNLVPIYNISTSEILESDKYEFFLEGIDDPLDDGDDEPLGWEESDSARDNINVRLLNSDNDYLNDTFNMTIPDYRYDRVIELFCDGDYADNVSFYRDFNIQGEQYLNLSFNTMLIDNYLPTFYYWFVCYGWDDQKVIEMYLDENGDFRFKSYLAGWETLESGIFVDNAEIQIDFFINYIDDIVLINLWVDDIFIATYIRGLRNIDSYGLKRIMFDVQYAPSASDYIYINLDWVGIYVNGLSNSTELGYFVLNGTSWEDNYHYTWTNLLSITAYGNATIGVCRYPNYVGNSTYRTMELLKLNRWDWNGSYFYNTQEKIFDNPYQKVLGVFNSCYSFYFTNFSLTSFNIQGIKLVNGNLTYYPEYTHGYNDIETDYFYVDDGLCHFSLNANNSQLEYIEVLFDIPNLLGENYSVEFRSNKWGTASASIEFDNIGSSNYMVEIPDYLSNTLAVLHQEKTIDKIGLVISDGDAVNGTTTGWVESLNLRYDANLPETLAMNNFTTMIIPVIVTLLLTFMFRKKFGKYGMFIGFIIASVISALSSLIPAWLFFIIIIGLAGLYLTKPKGEIK